mgnify:CR=1 FL=1
MKQTKIYTYLNKYLFKHTIPLDSMNKWFEILLGLILVLGTILIGWYSHTGSWTFLGLSWDFGSAAWLTLKGAVIWGVFFLGLLFLLLGISDLKN